MNQNKTFSYKRSGAVLLTGTLLSLSPLGQARAEDTITVPLNVDDAYSPDRLTPSTSDLASLLPLVLTSPERRELAEKLEAIMRSGDMAAAQNRLNSAIEVGTLAIVLAGQLKNPELLITLQNLGIKGENASPADPSMRCTVSVALTDLQEAIEREKNYSGMISQTLNDLMQENNTLKASLEKQEASQEAKISETQQALQREQERSEASARELVSLRNDYETLQSTGQADAAAATSTVEWESRLQEVQEQRDITTRQLEDVKKELHALQVLKEQESISQSAHVSELEKTLSRTQAQGDALARELISVNKELVSLKEPHQSSITPLVYRIERADMDAPLPPPVEDTTPREASTPPQSNATPLSPEQPAMAKDNATPNNQNEPTPVVIASLPTGLGSIPAVLPPQDPPKNEDRLTIRAGELLSKGDVSGARLLLERALDDRNPRAAFLMGETFDPNILTKLRVLGIRGDASKAREFYAQALALGIAEARARMEALK